MKLAVKTKTISELQNNMNDNQTPNEEDVVNTVFLEAREPVKEVLAQDQSFTISPKIRMAMGDDNWMAKQQLSKPVVIAKGKLTTANPRNYLLKQINFPEIISTVESVPLRTLQMYADFHAVWRIKVQINSSMMHQGKVALYVDPFHQSQVARSTNNIPSMNPAYTLMCPSASVSLSQSQTMEITVPFIHPRDYLTTNSRGFDILATVRLVVINPLQAVTGTSASVSWTMWMVMEDPEVHLPIAWHNFTYDPPTTRRRVKTTATMLSAITTTAAKAAGADEKTSSAIGQGADLVGNLASGNIAGAIGSGLGLAKNIFGLDYPSAPGSLDNTIAPVENLAIAKGAISHSQRLAIDPKSMHLPGLDTFGPLSEIDIKEIASRPSLIGQFAWSTTQTTGTSIFGEPLPITFNTSYRIKEGSGETIQYAAQPSFQAFIANAFCYIRGDVIYTFELIGTPFQTGKLIFGWVPNAAQPPTFEDITQSNASVTLDTQQASRFDVRIPFASPTSLKFTRPRLMPDRDAYDWDDEHILGYAQLYVLNELVLSNAVPNNLEINVYIRAADNFSVMVPKAPDYLLIAPELPEVTRATIGDIGSQVSRTVTAEQSVEAVLGLGSAMKPFAPRFGEEYALSDIIKRFSRATLTANNVTTTDRTITIPVHPFFMDLFGIPPDYFTSVGSSFMGYWSLIYGAWYGSIRVKIVTNCPRTMKATLTATHYPDYNVGAAVSVPQDGYATYFTNLAQQSAIEIEIPYYSLYNMLLTRPDSNETTGTNFRELPLYNGLLELRFQSEATSDNSISITMYLAAGDDFRFLYLRAPPQNWSTGINNPVHPATFIWDAGVPYVSAS